MATTVTKAAVVAAYREALLVSGMRWVAHGDGSLLAIWLARVRETIDGTATPERTVVLGGEHWQAALESLGLPRDCSLQRLRKMDPGA